MTTTLPTLYKRNSNATAIQQWTISVTDATITTTYGQVGGAVQTSHVGAFVCVTEGGKEFGAKGAMPNATLRQAWLEPEKWVGKRMTVKYFGKTADGSLRFPSALRLRPDSEVSS